MNVNIEPVKIRDFTPRILKHFFSLLTGQKYFHTERWFCFLDRGRFFRTFALQTSPLTDHDNYAEQFLHPWPSAIADKIIIRGIARLIQNSKLVISLVSLVGVSFQGPVPKDADKTASARNWIDIQPVRGTQHVM